MGSFDRDAFSQRLVARFTAEVTQRLATSMPPHERQSVLAIAQQALSTSIDSLNGAMPAAPRALPATRLKASEVIAQGLVALSQASLYRAAEQGRFYGLTPAGRSIGKVFPAWQFCEPVPELIGAVLACLTEQTDSDIHAFWVSAADPFNGLAPAELLAGLPFETRGQLHPSQHDLLALPARQRQQKVAEFATQQAGGARDVIG
jgi:hypothetical protein